MALGALLTGSGAGVGSAIGSARAGLGAGSGAEDAGTSLDADGLGGAKCTTGGSAESITGGAEWAAAAAEWAGVTAEWAAGAEGARAEAEAVGSPACARTRAAPNRATLSNAPLPSSRIRRRNRIEDGLGLGWDLTRGLSASGTDSATASGITRSSGPKRAGQDASQKQVLSIAKILERG